MSPVQAVVLAIIEGLTEFLPVSSTGHMMIGSALMGIGSQPFVKTFTVAIQLGAILSVVVMYWKRFFQSFRFYLVLLTAFIPAAVIGFLAGDAIDALLERVDVVGWTLITGGIFLLFVDRLFNGGEDTATPSFSQAFRIGLFQCIALVPGVSRSAATIVGGLVQGINRQRAAEFSFFLAVPTMAAATGYKLLKFFMDGNQFGPSEWSLLAIGNGVAFVVAWLTIRSFIGFLSSQGFRWFGYYRITVGAVLLLLYYFGTEIQVL